MKPEHKLFECKVADLLAGDLQPRSGAGDHDKLDVKTEFLLVSCKTTKNVKSFSLTEDDWREVVHFAKLEGLSPALACGFTNHNLTVLDTADLGGFLQEISELHHTVRKRGKSIKRLFRKNKELEAELQSAELKIAQLVKRNDNSL